MQISAEGADEKPGFERAMPRTVTLGWFLKRMILGVFILFIAMGSVAWLTYASIDPVLESGQAGAAIPASGLETASQL